MSAAVVISGRGAVTAHGDDPRRWPTELAQHPAVLEVSLDELPAPVRARAVRVERVTQLALVAAARALAGAALAVPGPQPDPGVGLVLGTAFGCFLTNAAFQQRLAAEGAPGASPRLFAATVSNAAAGEIAIAWRLGGPLLTLSAGCASGLVALAEAAALVDSARADALLAGGMDALGPPLERWLVEQGWPAGSEAAEGAAMLVLEDGARAAARGARPLGGIVGWSSGFEPPAAGGDAAGRRHGERAVARTAASGDGLAAAVTRALGRAAAASADLALVVSNVPAALGPLEARALAGIAAPRIRPKHALGETMGAAGPLGVLAALAAVAPDALALVVDACPSGHVAALVVRGAAA